MALNPFDVKVVESFDEFLSENVDDSSLQVSDTLTLLNDYIDSVETELDKSRLKGMMHGLYIEAQNSDAI
jgi:hypothetical protein